MTLSLAWSTITKYRSPCTPPISTRTELAPPLVEEREPSKAHMLDGPSVILIPKLRAVFSYIKLTSVPLSQRALTEVPLIT
ncbi:hypothetical protein HMI54_011701, partial [Coelomomyces lativittatus]